MRATSHRPSGIGLTVIAALALGTIALSCDRGSDGSRRPTLSAGGQPATRTARPATGPAATRPADPARRLYGTWVAEDVDVKLGEVKIKLVFREDGPVKILAWSDLPFVGQVKEKTAPYEATADTISSDAIRGGTTVKYRLEDDRLIIRYADGKTVAFRRT